MRNKIQHLLSPRIRSRLFTGFSAPVAGTIALSSDIGLFPSERGTVLNRKTLIHVLGPRASQRAIYDRRISLVFAPHVARLKGVLILLRLCLDGNPEDSLPIRMVIEKDFRTTPPIRVRIHGKV